MALKDYIERSFFGVCETIGNRIGIRSSRVRVYFIYISFVTLGSPIIIYLFFAFWLNVKSYIRNGVNTFME